MTSRKKILNDPVYGFISIPYGILFDLMEHAYFQRLRRIKQVGLTHYVYPGALHTRFHHALGALHLMQQAIEVLRSKGVEITDDEATAVSIAILLHDIGHGPFSHALENTLIDVSHEALSIMFMEKLNDEFDGQLSMALSIFKDEYSKLFLHQLVSSQLDMDRMDYLNRDSFYTGVSEGVIGYDRIIKMLTVKNGELLVEEKGIYSIEKFLIARRLMYWQVYLHKTALAAEQMLIKTLKRAKDLALSGFSLPVSESLKFFLYEVGDQEISTFSQNKLLEHFALLDDIDILAALKVFSRNGDKILSYLSHSLLHRKLFRIELKNDSFEEEHIQEIRSKLIKKLGFKPDEIPYVLLYGKEANTAYSTVRNEIKILLKSGEIVPISSLLEHGIQTKIITKHYLCYPKNIF